MPGHAEASYRVVYFDHTIKTIRSLADTATSLGIGLQFPDSLKAIQDKLKREPLRCGDSLYRHQHLGLDMCHGIHSLAHVYFAVDEVHRLVYVRDLLPMPSRWPQTP